MRRKAGKWRSPTPLGHGMVLGAARSLQVILFWLTFRGCFSPKITLLSLLRDVHGFGWFCTTIREARARYAPGARYAPPAG